MSLLALDAPGVENAAHHAVVALVLKRVDQGIPQFL
jgi:hypothetical protein